MIAAAIPIALQVAGTVGSLLSKKKNAPSYDYQALVNQLNTIYDERVRGAESKAKTIKRIGGTAVAREKAANDAYLAAEKERKARYAAESMDTGNALEDKVSADLYRRTRKGTREREQKVREELGASRTFRTSGGQKDLDKVSRDEANQLAEGFNAIAGQSLTRRQQAQDTLFRLDDNLMKEQLGFDKAQVDAMLKVATESEVGQINDVLAALKDKQDALTQIGVSQANANFARGVSDSQQPTGWDKLSALGSIGSQALNAYQLASNFNQRPSTPETPQTTSASPWGSTPWSSNESMYPGGANYPAVG